MIVPLCLTTLILGVCHGTGVLNVQDVSQEQYTTARVRRPVKSLRGDHAKTLLQNIALNPDLSKLYSLLQTRKILMNALNQTGANLTVFAPSNAAFDKAGDIPDDDSLTNAMLYHVVQPSLSIDALKDGMLLESSLSLKSLNDSHQFIQVFRRGDSVGLNWHSHVVVEEIEASNGFIHVVDRILMQPPDIVTALKHFPIHYGFFSLALEKTGLHRVFVSLTAATVFVPANSAFLSLGLRTLRYLFSAEGLPYLTLVMLYHGSHDLKYSTDFISDKKTTLPSLFAGRDVKVHYVNGVLFVNGEEARIVKPLDGLGDNGVFHPINKVLLPEAEYRVLEAQVEEYYRGQASEEDQALSALLESFMTQ